MAATAAVKNQDVKEYRQTIQSNYQKGTFAVDDADNHDFRVSAAGKGRFTVQVDNPSDKQITVSVWGAPDSSAEVGDADVVQIGSNFLVAASGCEYETVNDPFPYYLFRLVAVTGGDGSTATLYVHLSAF